MHGTMNVKLKNPWKGLETKEFFHYFQMSLLKIFFPVVLNIIKFLNSCATECTNMFPAVFHRQIHKPTSTLHLWISRLIQNCDVHKGLILARNVPSWIWLHHRKEDKS